MGEGIASRKGKIMALQFKHHVDRRPKLVITDKEILKELDASGLKSLILATYNVVLPQDIKNRAAKQGAPNLDPDYNSKTSTEQKNVTRQLLAGEFGPNARILGLPSIKNQTSALNFNPHNDTTQVVGSPADLLQLDKDFLGINDEELSIGQKGIQEYKQQGLGTTLGNKWSKRGGKGVRYQWEQSRKQMTPEKAQEIIGNRQVTAPPAPNKPPLDDFTYYNNLADKIMEGSAKEKQLALQKFAVGRAEAIVREEKDELFESIRFIEDMNWRIENGDLKGKTYTVQQDVIDPNTNKPKLDNDGNPITKSVQVPYETFDYKNVANWSQDKRDQWGKTLNIAGTEWRKRATYINTWERYENLKSLMVKPTPQALNALLESRKSGPRNHANELVRWNGGFSHTDPVANASAQAMSMRVDPKSEDPNDPKSLFAKVDPVLKKVLADYSPKGYQNLLKPNDFTRLENDLDNNVKERDFTLEDMLDEMKQADRNKFKQAADSKMNQLTTEQNLANEPQNIQTQEVNELQVAQTTSNKQPALSKPNPFDNFKIEQSELDNLYNDQSQKQQNNEIQQANELKVKDKQPKAPTNNDLSHDL